MVNLEEQAKNGLMKLKQLFILRIVNIAWQ